VHQDLKHFLKPQVMVLDSLLIRFGNLVGHGTKFEAAQRQKIMQSTKKCHVIIFFSKV